MSTRPILFGTDMVRALLEDRKTVTRRVVKPQPLWRKPPVKQEGYPGYWANWDDKKIYKAPCRPGDILYVRETWARSMAGTYLYRATDTPIICDSWSPSIHMPKEAARIFLRVTDVRVERLHDITIVGMQMEGAKRKNLRPHGCSCAWKTDACMDEPCSNRDAYEYECQLFSFIELWDSTIKKVDHGIYGWGANPWVWVIEFERISREEAGQC